MNNFNEVSRTETLVNYRLEKMTFLKFFMRTQRDLTLMEKIIEERQPEDNIDDLQAVVDEYEARSR